MPWSDFFLVFQWWSALFLVGVAGFPLTKRLFSSWFDRGYLFSKAVGMAVVSYMVFLVGTLHLVPFTFSTVLGTVGILFAVGVLFSDRTNWTCKTNRTNKQKNKVLQFFSFARRRLAKLIFIVLLEETFFFCALLLWSWVKAHEPSIRGLEKFMDYGFMQSLLNSAYFPAPDMWWAGGSINYYYFGHLVTAVLTRLSGLDLAVTFNLMLATLFALTLTMSFSIGYQLQLISKIKNQKSKIQIKNQKEKIFEWMRSFVAGGLTAFLVTLAGNMQTIYAFTKGYIGEAVVPFWTVLWSPAELLGKLGEGMNRYWYANATRFIPFTIHEFPSYSFVVSDVHGHVLSIPFVLLVIGLLIMLFGQNMHDRKNFQFSIFNFQSKFQISNFKFQIVFYGFLLGILLMTNALDGPIYLGLLIASLGIFNFQFSIFKRTLILPLIAMVVGVITIMVLTALPFLIHFKSFAAGIGVNCPIAPLANMQIGPFIFEGVDKCQKSPLWMMGLLWGFFWYIGAWLFIRSLWSREQNAGAVNRIMKAFYLFGLFLVIVPEFFYVKDIYPAHFRSNTMFKLGYQAFILWSIVAGYVIVHMLFQRDSLKQIFKSQFSIFKQTIKFQISNFKQKARVLFFLLLIPQLFLVSIYPIFSIRSYFGELKNYQSIYGLTWLKEEFPSDLVAVEWMKNAVRQSESSFPVLVEADGDSYTDYNHISAFSGVPTVVGWAVHEWLWRGSYDSVAPRRDDVRTIYTSQDRDKVKELLERYRVRYIVIGPLEWEKYPELNESLLAGLGTIVFQSGDTTVYEVAPAQSE